ncbi:class I SAM-dependent methyltransferase [Schlesneria paludicola]|uniref:class I SAM-dependent methyltransferase n=1 Tax=Schlesneria paludicola TaxID=360056 RepID=UPI00029AAB73|nr:class I SAM-dependent methyltransferase [Schlesneria paludicola]
MDQPQSRVELEDKPCPLCGASHFARYLVSADNSKAVSGTFQIVRCLDCRHLYTNPRPTPETVLNCYPTDYGPHRVHSEAEAPQEAAPSTVAEKQTETPQSRPWYLSPAARRIPGLRALYYWLTNDYSNIIPTGLKSGAQVVELGCANGAFLQKLQARGCNVEGVEPVASAAEEAKRRGFRVHAGTLESLVLDNNSRDAFFAWMVVEHLLNPKDTLLEIHRALRPDGWLVFSVPNAGCWEPILFSTSWFAYDLPRHLQHFTPRRLTRLLNDCGYDRVTVVHQRNLLNVVSSVGLVLTRWFPNSPLAQKILAWSDRPTLWCQLALAPLAVLLAGLHQGGRLTVIARRPAAE